MHHYERSEVIQFLLLVIADEVK